MTNPFDNDAWVKKPGAFKQAPEVFNATTADARILTKQQVRKLLQLLHPDKYRGHNADLAREMFEFFVNYEGLDKPTRNG